MDLANFLLDHGSVDALALDGGGSSQLILLEDGKEVTSTMGSEQAVFRSGQDPFVSEFLAQCTERFSTCTKPPCKKAQGCHRPVPAFFAVVPK